MTARVRIVIVAGIATLVAACAGPAASTSSPSSRGGASTGGASTPQPTAKKETKLVKVDAATAERLQSVMVPLLRVMDHPVQPGQVKVGVMDDDSINAANAGNNQFLVTTGLLQSSGGSSGGGFLATHPGTTDRVTAVQALPGS